MHTLKTYLHIVCSGEHAEACARMIAAFTADFERLNCRTGAVSFAVGINREYDVDVNNMLQKTLAPFLGREQVLKRGLEEAGAKAYLEIVAELDHASEQPAPILGLDAAAIAFCHTTGILPDLDYYLL